jgi:Rrf2 family nitric oxide-sensitive transcriptional repressor
MKVVHRLGQGGFVETTRGRGGGLRLAREAERITVGEVVRHSEERMDLVECFDPETNACRIAPACALQGVLGEALDAFLGILDAATLADLVARRRSRLRALLEPT